MNTLNFEERTLQEATANVVGGVDRNVVDSIFIRIQDHFRKILFSDIPLYRSIRQLLHFLFTGRC